MTNESEERNRIIIDNEVFQKMVSYAKIADEKEAEIIGLLLVNELKEGGLQVEDMILPTQEISGAYCEAIWEGDWLKDLVKSKQIERIRGFWHSHRHMGTWLSGHDKDIIEDKWDVGDMPWAISIVVSLPNEIKAWLQFYKPIKLQKIEIPVFIVQPPSDEIFKKCQADVELKIKKKTYSWTSTKAGEKTFLSKTPTGGLDDDEDVDPVTGFSYDRLNQMFGLKRYDESTLKKLEEEKAKCLFLSYNKKGRLICFFSGKNYDCETCHRNPDKWKKALSESETDSPIVALAAPKEDEKAVME